MTLIEAALLGVVQGLTEFLPVSSSAHLILARVVFGWDAGSIGRPFDVACHLGTLLAVIVYFRVDLARVVRAVPGALSGNADPRSHRVWLIAAATLPIVCVGVFLSESIDWVRSHAELTAYALIAGAGLLFLVERINVRPSTGRAGAEDRLTAIGAGLVGIGQALALIPGVSRSGATITAGMLLGLTRLEAARFAFLIAVPAIAAAAVNEAWGLRGTVLTAHQWQLFATGLVTSGLVGYVAVSALLRFLVSHRLDVFAWYRIVVGVAILFWL